MRTLKPFQLTVLATDLAAKPLVAASRRIYSALITAKGGNVGDVVVGGKNAAGAPDPKTGLPLELPVGTDAVNYDLADLYLKAANVGDGVEIFGFE